MDSKKPPHVVRPTTAVLTRGFDPSLSVVRRVRPCSGHRPMSSLRPSPPNVLSIALGRGTTPAGRECRPDLCAHFHPNAEILEDQIVPLEPGARDAAVFNSGMAAISTIFFTVCRPGNTFVYTTPLYGGTYHLIHQILEPFGIHGIPVRAGDTGMMRKTIASARNLRVVFIETPANPILTMTDIAAATAEAKQHPDSPLVAVDNTFLGPTFQHPLECDADLAVYSATKFLSGFSDLIGGVILARDPSLIAELHGTRAILGNILQADECWLLDGRLPTVTLRMNRQSKNAQRIAEDLARRKISKVHYPTLCEDPEQVRIRDAQCRFPEQSCPSS